MGAAADPRPATPSVALARPADVAKPVEAHRPVEPPKPTAKLVEAAKPVEPKHIEPAKPAKPIATAKKPDAKKPDARHTAAPERVARAAPKAQPIDPYAAAPGPKADPAAAYKTGLQQYARGDTSGALATLRGSASSSPGFAPTWRGLGLVYEKLGDKGQARASFKRYLKLAPTASDADQVRDRLERLGS